MLRVIIADDEERICQLIKVLADWDRLQMEVVGIAGNGPEALALVQTLSPDILITDIRMPGCSGLELISRAKALLPTLEVIIISGYAQFDYAQTAIQYGVGEYLLKPVNQEALNATLEKMGNRCREQSEQNTKSLHMRKASDQVRLRTNLIPDLLSGRYAARDSAELQETYHFDGKSDMYQVCLLKMDYDPEQFPEPSLDIVRTKAEDILRPALLEICDDFILGGPGPALYGVLNYAAKNRDLLRSTLRECLNELVALTSLFGPVVFSMALGQAVSAPEALHEAFLSAQSIISERLTEGTGRLLERASPPSALHESNPLAGYIQSIARAIELLSLQEAANAATALEEAVAAVPKVTGAEVLELVRGAGAVFFTRLGFERREQMMLDFDKRCGQCATFREIFDCLQKTQALCLSSAIRRQQDQAGQPIRIAKQYIQKHFSDPLTLEEVSDITGFSVNYFSTLFKKETGEGFAKYVTRVRMEEARRFLRETRLPVSEICKRVGYADVKHFTHAFKAAAGLTPGEFRKLYG